MKFPNISENSTCRAKRGSDPDKLGIALHYACDPEVMDCSPINPGMEKNYNYFKFISNFRFFLIILNFTFYFFQLKLDFSV